VPFARYLERVDDAPGHQPEVARIDRNRDLGHVLRRAIEEPRRPQFEGALPLAAAAHRIHDVKPGLPAFDHRRDQLRRVLQIRVDQHDRVTARDVQPRRRRELMSEIPREPHDDEPRIGLRLRPQQLGGPIGAPVIDQHDLVRVNPRRPVRRRPHPPHELGNIPLLVVQRSNDAQGRHPPSF